MTEREKMLEEVRGDWLRATKSLLDAMPEDYGLLSTAIAGLRHDFFSATALSLGLALSQKIKGMPSGTYSEKHEIARFVNDEAQKHGLTLCCPVSKQPSILHVMPASVNNPRGRFDLRSKGHLSKSTVSRVEILDLLPLQLMEAPPRREALAEWHRRTKSGGGEKQI